MWVYTCIYIYIRIYTRIYNVIPCHLHRECTYPHSNAAETCMMQPEPSVLAPRVSLSESHTLPDTWHLAQNTPGTGFSRHHRIEVVHSHINWICILQYTSYPCIYCHLICISEYILEYTSISLHIPFPIYIPVYTSICLVYTCISRYIPCYKPCYCLWWYKSHVGQHAIVYGFWICHKLCVSWPSFAYHGLVSYIMAWNSINWHLWVANFLRKQP